VRPFRFLAIIATIVFCWAPTCSAQSKANLPTWPYRGSPTDALSVRTRDWRCIRWYESRDNYGAVGDQYGAYQFSLATWRMLGYRGMPNLAPRWEQDQAALRLYHWDAVHIGNPWSGWETAVLCGL
jgi:hypothetical protein